jgi:ADP-ribosylglycohydrolase
MAVGDALGGPLRDRRLQAPTFPELTEGIYRETRGGGVLGLQPGQVAVPTQMATVLATSVRELSGFRAEDVHDRYVKWLPFAKGVSEHTQEVLKATPRHLASFSAWQRSSRRAAGAEPLARAVALAVAFAKAPEELGQHVLEDCALTHFDPRCRIASAALSGTLASALTSAAPPTADTMLEAAEASLNLAASRLAKLMPEFVLEVKDAALELKEDVAAAKTDDPQLYGPSLHLHRGDSARVTFRLAFWELLHAPSFEAGVMDATHRGGQADMNGAITGALLGAMHGDTAVPRDLKERVESALERERGPLRSLYHPLQLALLAR